MKTEISIGINCEDGIWLNQLVDTLQKLQKVYGEDAVVTIEETQDPNTAVLIITGPDLSAVADG